MPLRVGTVPYLVGRPLDLGLGEEPGIELARDVPARLVAGLRGGALDVALVSSIELFRRPGYRWLDGVAVAGRGPVRSVQVFTPRPIDEVRSVSLDPASRAAAALVRTLLADRPGGPPEFVEVDEGADARAAGTDAWLRIGDRALVESIGEGLASWNPAAAWTERTGLPFVFAAWIVAPGVDVAPHLDAFARARARGAEAIEDVVRSGAAAWELPVEACHAYLTRECVYEPGPDSARALRAFRDRAARLGLADAALDPRPVPLAPRCRA